MKKKISKKLREDAANVCSARASEWTRSASSISAFNTYPFSSPALAVAADAQYVVIRKGHRFTSLTDDWAEAEAMLREGWSP